jgi:hypothetical protein
MANTYTLISSYAASGSVASIDFTSIPSTYTDLILDISLRSNRSDISTAYNDGVLMTFNGSGTGYLNRAVEGTGSSVAAFTGLTSSINLNQIPTINATASTFSNTLIYIPNYAGSNNKSLSLDYAQENNMTFSLLGLTAGVWSNTAAITSIKLAPQVGTAFLQYSTAYLYGVNNA